MKRLSALLLALLSACTSLETRPVRVTQVYPPGSVRPDSPAVKGGADAAEPKDSLALKPGQVWTYRRIDLWRKEETERFRQELMFVEAGRWMTRWTILNSDDPYRRGSITGEIFDPENHVFADRRLTGRYEPLRFPLAPGKSWSFQYSVSGNSRQTRIEQTATVRGWETVTVPAGSFRTVRVEHAGRYSAVEGGSSWSGKIRETIWYAPSTGRIVMREYRDTKGDGSPWDQWRDELVELRL